MEDNVLRPHIMAWNSVASGNTTTETTVQDLFESINKSQRLM